MIDAKEDETGEDTESNSSMTIGMSHFNFSSSHIKLLDDSPVHFLSPLISRKHKSSFSATRKNIS